jgi:hypothetical protein
MPMFPPPSLARVPPNAVRPQSPVPLQIPPTRPGGSVSFFADQGGGTGGMTLDALMLRQRELARQQADLSDPGAQTSTIAGGLGHMLDRFTTSFQQGQARRQETAGRQQLAELLGGIDPNTGIASQEQLSQIAALDPELGQQLFAAAIQARQGAAQEATRLAERAEERRWALEDREQWETIAAPEGADPTKVYQRNKQTGQIEAVGGGGTNITVGGKGETKWEETVASEQAKIFTAAAQEGVKARGNLLSIDQLDKMIDQIPTGASAAMTDYLKSNWGISLEGADKLSAFNAIINQLTPQQRPAGSGTMSDRDIELFKASLPSMMNTPEGNRQIIQYLRGMAQYNAAIGDLSQQVITGKLDRNAFYDEAAKIANPLASVGQTPPPEGYTEQDVTDTMAANPKLTRDQVIERMRQMPRPGGG